VLVQTAGRYKAQVCLYLEGSERNANARSIIQLLKLGVRQGDKVKIVVEGDDATEALAAILNMLANEAIS
jgi:phosphotransferase system HPr (HPr) family protein